MCYFSIIYILFCVNILGFLLNLSIGLLSISVVCITIFVFVFFSLKFLFGLALAKLN